MKPIQLVVASLVILTATHLALAQVSKSTLKTLNEGKETATMKHTLFNTALAAALATTVSNMKSYIEGSHVLAEKPSYTELLHQ